MDVVSTIMNNPITLCIVVGILWWRVGAIEKRLGAKLDNGLLSDMTDIRTKFTTFSISTKEALRQLSGLRSDCKDLCIRLDKLEATCAERGRHCPELVHAGDIDSEAR